MSPANPLSSALFTPSANRCCVADPSRRSTGGRFSVRWRPPASSSVPRLIAADSPASAPRFFPTMHGSCRCVSGRGGRQARTFSRQASGIRSSSASPRYRVSRRGSREGTACRRGNSGAGTGDACQNPITFGDRPGPPTSRQVQAREFDLKTTGLVQVASHDSVCRRNALSARFSVSSISFSR